MTVLRRTKGHLVFMLFLLIALLLVGTQSVQDPPLAINKADNSDKATVDLSLFESQKKSTGRLRAALPDRTVTLTRKKVEQRGSKDYTWYGKVAGKKYSTAVMTVVNGVGVGYIDDGGTVYRVSQDNTGQYTVSKEDPNKAAKFDDDGVDPESVTQAAEAADLETTSRSGSKSVQLSVAPTSTSPLAPTEALTEDGSQIDLLLLYTPGMQTKYGPGLDAQLQSLVDLTNAAYANSAITTRIRLVGKALYSNASSNEGVIIDTALSHIRTSATVGALRDSYKADLVALTRVYNGSAGACGLGYVMQTVSSSFASLAFNVSEVRPAAEANPYYCDSRTLAHEIGHNLGSAHDRNHASVVGAFPYSYGHDVSGLFGTIMSYDGPRITYFSTPLRTYSGQPVGIADGQANSADNARSINNTSLVAANFRIGDPGQEISVDPISGGYGAVYVGANAPKTYTVSNPGSATLDVGTIGLSGTDSGEFTLANDYCSGQALPASGSCTFEVSFSPTSAGTKSANASIPSNDVNENPVSIPVTGIAALAGIPPSTTAATTPAAPGPTGWYGGAPTVSLASDIAGTIYYKWDTTSDPWSTYSAPLATQAGDHILHYRTIGDVGGIEDWKSLAVKVDAAIPTNPTVTSPSHTVNMTSSNSTVTVNLAGASDGAAGSGVDGFSYVWDSAPYTAPDTIKDIEETEASLVFTVADGAFYLHIRTKDNAGNWSTASHRGPFKVDTTPPVITMVTTPLAPNGRNGWYKTLPSIMLNRSETGYSYYQWDTTAGSWLIYTLAKQGLAGIHTFNFKAIDMVGNAGSVQSRVLQADNILPINATAASPSHVISTTSWSADNTIDINLSGGSDTISGVDGFSVLWNQSTGGYPDATKDAEETASSISSPPLSDGRWYLHYLTLDNAGNISAARHLGPFGIDVGPPTTTATVTPSTPTGAGGWYKTKPSISLVRSEAGTTQYQWDSTTGTWSNYIAAVPALAGDHTLYYRSTDIAGNTETARSVNVKVDITAPITTWTTLPTTPDGNAGWFRTIPTISLNRNEPGATKYQWNSTYSATWNLYSAPIPGREGVQRVYFQSSDNVGLVEKIKYATFKVDVRAPGGALKINNGLPQTGSTSAYLNSTMVDNAGGSGAAMVRFSNDGDFDTSPAEDWRTYTTSIPWVLDSGDGIKTVYAQFQDKAGNISASLTDTITLDTVAPSGSVSINSGAAYSRLSLVTLDVSSASDPGGVGVGEMRISPDMTFDVTFSSERWVAYKPTTSYSFGVGDGNRPVFVQFRDRAGNISSSATDSIFMDRMAPVPSMVLNGGAPATNTPSMTADVSGAYDTGSGLSQMRFSADSYFDSSTQEAWQPYSPALFTRAFSTPDSYKYLYGEFKDMAGNVAKISKSVLFDTRGALTTVSVAPYSSATPTGNNPVAWRASDPSPGSGASAYEIQYKNGLTGTWNTWQSSVTSTTATFAASAGNTYYFRGRTRDKAGNWGPYSAEIRHIAPYDSGSLSYSGVWNFLAGPSYYLGGVRYATAAGAYTAMTVNGNTVGLIVTKGPAMGRISIYIDNVLKSSVDTYSSVNWYRQYIPVASFTDPAVSHEVRVVNLATPGHPRFEIDGLAVSK